MTCLVVNIIKPQIGLDKNDYKAVFIHEVGSSEYTELVLYGDNFNDHIDEQISGFLDGLRYAEGIANSQSCSMVSYSLRETYYYNETVKLIHNVEPNCNDLKMYIRYLERQGFTKK